MKAYMNWSGGKDSALALYKALKDPSLHVDALLTNVNSVYDRISMHGVRRSLLELQAGAIGIPLQTIELPQEPSMNEYEKAMFNKVASLKQEGYDKAIFGDIFLEDLKLYREQQLSKAGIDCVFPLWKMDTSSLIKEFITLDFKTIIVCVNEKYLDKSFCGRIIDEEFIKDLPENVDPCGENGEFHTFVFEGPIFKHPIPITVGEITYRKYKAPKNANDNCFQPTKVEDYGFYFCDLLPA
jgi:uncharacterized protein (TIGR00290 family)